MRTCRKPSDAVASVGVARSLPTVAPKGIQYPTPLTNGVPRRSAPSASTSQVVQISGPYLPSLALQTKHHHTGGAAGPVYDMMAAVIGNSRANLSSLSGVPSRMGGATTQNEAVPSMTELRIRDNLQRNKLKLGLPDPQEEVVAKPLHEYASQCVSPFSP